MVKNKVNVCNYAKSLYKFNAFKEKISMKYLGIYLVLFLISLTIVSLIGNYITNDFKLLELLVVNLFGVPFSFFIFFNFFYVILNALEGKRKPYLESYLVFLATILPFTFIGAIFTIILNLVKNSLVLLNLTYILIFIVYGFLFFSFIMNLRTYFQTSSFKLLTTIFLITIFVSILVLFQFVTLIIDNV